MRSRHGRWAAALAVAVGGAAALAACGSGGASYADLERDATEQDAPPRAAADAIAERDADPESSRFVGAFDGHQVWLLRAEPNAVCMVVQSAEEPEWLLSCGGDGLTTTLADGTTFFVQVDGLPAPADATAVSQNVFAQDGG